MDKPVQFTSDEIGYFPSQEQKANILKQFEDAMPKWIPYKDYIFDKTFRKMQEEQLGTDYRLITEEAVWQRIEEDKKEL